MKSGIHSINEGKAIEKTYYGKFHVILIKEQDSWKILMDYDSNENKTIGEADYQAAFAIDEFDK